MAGTIIETKALTKRYGALTAVDDLNLTVRQGEVFGLLGPNGAGKTTTTLMLLGLTEPTAGSASISGVDCTRNPIQVKRFVGYLPDNMGFYPDMTGRQNLRMTGAMNGLSGDYLEARIDELVARVGMTEAVDRRAGTYSKGMKQRLGIADILIKDPDVLIMDEPTNGIDPEGMHELMALIRELADKDGKTILISSHQLHQIQQICDRVGIFVKGKLVACDTPENLERLFAGKSTVELTAEAAEKDIPGILSGVSHIVSRTVKARQDGACDVTLELDVPAENEICRDIFFAFSKAGKAILRMTAGKASLEDIFMELTDSGKGEETK